MNPISGRTRIVCVIGDPIAHSRSPAMHNAAFAHLGLDYAYVAFHVVPRRLAEAVAGFRALQIAGVNVTVPHKEAVLPLLDAVSATARQVGAVNTVVNRGGRLAGENTDVHGFRQALAEAGAELRGARVVVVGAGGAARAVLVALAQVQAADVLLLNRTTARARRLAALFGGARLRIEVAPLAAARRLDFEGAQAVINTTSVGLEGESFPPLPYASAPRDCVFFDLIPRPETDFLVCAARARRRTLDGTTMLLHQGAASFELWTGHRAPLAVMRRALRRAL